MANIARNKGGAPINNKNAVRHGAYIKRYDRRTVVGRQAAQIEAALTTALGDNPSPQEILIIQRVAVKSVRCAIIERELFSQDSVSPELERNYLRWSRELRADLKLLGLKRIEKVLNLDTYVEGKYG